MKHLRAFCRRSMNARDIMIQLSKKNVPGLQMIKGRSWVLLLFFVLMTLISSCGYHFGSMGGIIPEGAKTISIPAFVNGTMEPYVDVEVTKAVVNEFLTDGRLNVVSYEAADLVLRGKITKFTVTPASYTTSSYVQSYNISISVSISLEDVKTHKVLLQDQGLGTVFVSSYSVTLGDITATKIAKEAAIQSASKDLASTIRSKVLEGF